MDYNAIKNRADKLIQRYSDLTVTLVRVDTDGYTKKYDPVTDTYKWYYNGSVVSAPTETTYIGHCMETSSDDYMVARGYIKETDKVFITADLPKPLKNDSITVNGTNYTIYRVDQVSPGGSPVLYYLYARV